MEDQTVDDPEAMRQKMRDEMAVIEKQEQQLEDNKYAAEHDGMSLRDIDPEDLHPQDENFSPIEA